MWHAWRKKEYACRVFVGKLEGKNLLEFLAIDGRKCLDWMLLVQDREE
jgi:hypothetical protein